MLKCHFFILMLSLFSLQVSASEITTLLGTPDPSTAFVREMEINRVPFGIESPETKLTTYVYSLLNISGIKSATALEIINSDGAGSEEDFNSALHRAALTAPVALVLTGTGEMDSECRIMASHADVVYVLASKDIQLENNPNCGAANILLVAALAEDRTRLVDFSGYGLGYRIAAPAKVLGKGLGDIDLTVIGVTPGATLTGSHLVHFQRKHPGLTGGNLVQKFLDEATDRVPTLIGKVEEGRILRKSIEE